MVLTMWRVMAERSATQVTVMWPGDTTLHTTVATTGQCGSIQTSLEAVALIAEELFVNAFYCTNDCDNN